MDIRTQRLNEAFNASGLTQTELCEKTGLTKGAISSYLSGRYFPKQKTTEALAKALNVSVSYLMGYDDVDYWLKKTWEDVNTDDDPHATYYIEPETAEILQELHDRPELKVLHKAGRKASKEDIEQVAALLEKLSNK